MGVNPDDPVAMASIQRVASTFFNAIDKKEGSPYVFRGDKQLEAEPSKNVQRSEPAEDSDQEELDRFIAEIEDAADKEWAAEEEADKEELNKIRYWNREDLGGRFRRSEMLRSEDSDDDIRGGVRSRKDAHSGRWTDGSDGEDDNISVDDEEWDSDDAGDVRDYESDHDRARNQVPRVERGKKIGVGGANSNGSFKRDVEAKFQKKLAKEDSGSGSRLSDVENAMWQSESEEEQDIGQSKVAIFDYRSSSDGEEDYLHMNRDEKSGVELLDVVNHIERNADDFDKALDKTDSFKAAGGKQNKIFQADNREALKSNAGGSSRGKIASEKHESEDVFSDSEIAMYELDTEDELGSETSRFENYDYRSNSEEEEYVVAKKDGNDAVNDKKMKSPKQVDETWDSD